MHRYFIKTPWWVKRFFSSYTWDIKTGRREVFLTFDDGPHPVITPWVMEQLKAKGAKATFFCIGDNVRKYPEVVAQLIAEGHSIGNHTYHHLDGWKTDADTYLNDISKAAGVISSELFRPPYGKINSKAAKKLTGILGQEAKIIMWDVLSADFDTSISKEECLDNVLRNIESGSVIVFHDSEKAYPHLSFVLPIVLEYLQNENYMCSAIGSGG